MGKFRYLSVCSGIEAASVAWHDLEWEPVAFAEIDPFASAVLAHRYPGVPNLGDFTKIGVEHVGAVDALVGGTPCQSFSVAGLRGGLGDSRGNLALEFLRLADRTRPRWILWENVPGVFSATSHVAPDPCQPQDDLDGPDGPKDGEEIVVEDEYDSDEDHAFSYFLAGLSELGYGYAYGTLDAQHFGVPQRRRRVFVVGYLGDWRCAAAVLLDLKSLSGDSAPSREAGQSVAGTIKGGTGERGYPDPSDGNGGGLIPTTSGTLGGGGGSCGWSNDLDRSGAFIPGPYWDGSDTADTLDASNASNASKQQAMPEKRRFQAVVVNPVTSHPYADRGDGDLDKLVPVAFKASHFTRGKDGAPSDIVPPLSADADKGDQDTLVCFRAAGQDGFTPSSISPPIAGTDGGGAGVPTIAFSCKDSGLDCGELSPTLRSMGHDGSHANAGGRVAVVFDTTQIASPGNYSNPQPGDPCHPLASEAHVPAIAFNLRGREGGAMAEMAEMAEMASIRAASGGSSKTYVKTSSVRRLTPMECERLQGFPDGFTKITSKTADSSRYRVLGNSMAVPVMKWLGERIQAVDDLKSVDAPHT